MNKEEKENRMENIIVIVLFVIVLGALIFWYYSATRGGGAEEEDVARILVPIGTSPRIGNESAPVLVIEFSDFECPYCARFALDSFPQIKEQYIDTGQVLFVYKNFPLTRIHKKAFRASLAAACAEDQEMFWEFHDVLYANQNALEIGQLQTHAEELGLDMEFFDRCFISEELSSEVRSDMQIGINSGVSGTPTFFFNGRKVSGFLTPEQFGAEVQAELAEQ